MPTRIRGVVRSADGRPLPGARVAFVEGPVALPDVAALSAEDGRFTLTAPARGRYRIAAFADDAPAMETVVDVDGPEAEVELRPRS
jgi:hypothetical protein